MIFTSMFEWMWAGDFSQSFLLSKVWSFQRTGLQRLQTEDDSSKWCITSLNRHSTRCITSFKGKYAVFCMQNSCFWTNIFQGWINIVSVMSFTPLRSSNVSLPKWIYSVWLQMILNTETVSQLRIYWSENLHWNTECKCNICHLLSDIL